MEVQVRWILTGHLLELCAQKRGPDVEEAQDPNRRQTMSGSRSFAKPRGNLVNRPFIHCGPRRAARPACGRFRARLSPVAHPLRIRRECAALASRRALRLRHRTYLAASVI